MDRQLATANLRTRLWLSGYFRNYSNSWNHRWFPKLFRNNWRTPTQQCWIPLCISTCYFLKITSLWRWTLISAWTWTILRMKFFGPSFNCLSLIYDIDGPSDALWLQAIKFNRVEAQGVWCTGYISILKLFKFDKTSLGSAYSLREFERTELVPWCP